MEQYTPEDEKFILEQGLNSPFWQIISTKWEYFRKIAMNSLLSPEYGHRDFLAGKIKGMDDLLNYPSRHIETLKAKIENSKK